MAALAACLVQAEAASLGLFGRAGRDAAFERRTGNGACSPPAGNAARGWATASTPRPPSTPCSLPSSSYFLSGTVLPRVANAAGQRQRWRGRGHGVVASVAVEEELVIEPIRSIEGTVKLPGSKSLSNRLLLMAALAQVSTSHPPPRALRGGFSYWLLWLPGMLSRDHPHAMGTLLHNCRARADPPYNIGWSRAWGCYWRGGAAAAAMLHYAAN